MEDQLDISVVIPVYNEQDSLASLHSRLNKVLDDLGLVSEIIMVDDGSDDTSAKIMKELFEQDPRLRIITLRRNFGQTAALSAGFNHAKGKIVVSLDADEQNSPEDIPALIDKINEGYDVVNGWRKDRKDAFLTRILPSKIANFMIGLLTGIKLHDFGCTLKAYRSEVLDGIDLYGEMHRMIPVLAHWMGAKITEIEVNHDQRLHGKSKYSISRTLSVILDLMTLKFFMGYFTRPLHLFGLLGLVVLLLGFGSGVAVVLMKIFSQMNMTGNPFLILSVLLVIVGVQLVVMGLLGEITIRTYYESQKKPIYYIRGMLDH